MSLMQISPYLVQDATDGVSRGVRGGVDEYDSVYDAETEPSEEEGAGVLPAMPDTIGQQTLPPSAMQAEATSFHRPDSSDRGVHISAVFLLQPPAQRSELDMEALP